MGTCEYSCQTECHSELLGVKGLHLVGKSELLSLTGSFFSFLPKGIYSPHWDSWALLDQKKSDE